MALLYYRLLGIAILTLQLTFSLGIPLFKDVHSLDEHFENGTLNLQKKNAIASLEQEKDQTSVTDQPSTPVSPEIGKKRLKIKNAIPSTDASIELGNTSSRIKNGQRIASTPGQNKNGGSLVFGIKEENATLINGKNFEAATESHPYSKAADEYTTVSYTSKYTNETDARYIQENSGLNTEETPKSQIKDIREKTQSLQEKTLNVKLMQQQDNDAGKAVEGLKVDHSIEDTTTSLPRTVTTRKNDYHQNKMVDTEIVTGHYLASQTHKNIPSLETNSDQRDTSFVFKESEASGNELSQKTISSLENETAIPVATVATEVKQGHKNIVSSQENVTPVNAHNNLSLVMKSDKIVTSSNHKQSDVKGNGPSQKIKVNSMNETQIFLASTTTEENKGPQKSVSLLESAAHMISLLVGYGKSKTSSNNVKHDTIENSSKQEGKSNSEVDYINSTIYVTSAINEDRQKVLTKKDNTTPTATNIPTSSMKYVKPRTRSNLKVSESTTSKSVVSIVTGIREDHQSVQQNKGNIAPNLGKVSTREMASEVDTISSTIYITSPINEDRQKVMTNKEITTPAIKNITLSSMKLFQPGTISKIKVAEAGSDVSHQEENETAKSVVSEKTSIREDHQKVNPNKSNTTTSPGDISTSGFSDHKVKRINSENGALSTRVAGTSESKIHGLPKFLITNFLNIEEPSTSENSKPNIKNYILIDAVSSLNTTDIPEKENVRINPDNAILSLDNNKPMDLFLHDIFSSWNDNYTSGTHEFSSKGVVTSIPAMPVMDDSLIIGRGNANGTTVKDVFENNMTIAIDNESQRLSQDSISLNPASTEDSASKQVGSKLNHIPLSQNVLQLSEMQELFNGFHLPFTGVIF